MRNRIGGEFSRSLPFAREIHQSVALRARPSPWPARQSAWPVEFSPQSRTPLVLAAADCRGEPLPLKQSVARPEPNPACDQSIQAHSPCGRSHPGRSLGFAIANRPGKETDVYLAQPPLWYPLCQGVRDRSRSGGFPWPGRRVGASSSFLVEGRFEYQILDVETIPRRRSKHEESEREEEAWHECRRSFQQFA
jgi:hypothetical protein